jgi:hypothetical protein
MVLTSREKEKFTRVNVLILREIKKISRDIKKNSRVFSGFCNMFLINLREKGRQPFAEGLLADRQSTQPTLYTVTVG